MFQTEQFKNCGILIILSEGDKDSDYFSKCKMRNIWKNADFVMKPFRGQSPSANDISNVLWAKFWNCVQEQSQFNLWNFAPPPLSSRLCGRQCCCKKGLLNLHSQRPFLTQSVASCHITLPSCPLPCFALHPPLLLLANKTLQTIYGGQPAALAGCSRVHLHQITIHCCCSVHHHPVPERCLSDQR